MHPLIPRSYQRDTVDRALAALARNPVVVSPTGSGKSFVGSLIVHELARPTIWMTHRKELVDQAHAELCGFGIKPGFIMAGRAYYALRQVQVASVDTLRRRDVPAPRLIVIDEAHHAVSKQFRSVIDRWPDVPRVGLTATPYRLDNRGLGDVFGEIVETPHAPGISAEQQLVNDGFLVEPKVYAPPAESVAGVKTVGGDYNRGELARIVDKPKLIGDVLETWKRHAVDDRGVAGCYLTIGFACSVEHSKHLVAAFCAAGVAAEHVDAETPSEERAAILARFKAGTTRVLWNVALFTEGFNVPAVECIVIARPTQSLGLHRQMLGRATRISDGKRYPIVLDHAGNVFRHGRIVRPMLYSLESGAFPTEGTGLRTCPMCFRMCDARRARCPECGVDFASVSAPRDAMPETVDGQLEEYRDPDAQQAAPAPVYTPEDKERFFRETYEVAAERGWNPNAVRVRFKEKFGHWPVVVEVDGEHRLATPESGDDVKAAALAKFTAEGAEKGFKPGYAAARFKDLFQHWPRACHRAAAPAVDAGLFQKAGAA
jgi:DNA repair protein RadD